jgi:hypothetical protein
MDAAFWNQQSTEFNMVACSMADAFADIESSQHSLAVQRLLLLLQGLHCLLLLLQQRHQLPVVLSILPHHPPQLLDLLPLGCVTLDDWDGGCGHIRIKVSHDQVVGCLQEHA